MNFANIMEIIGVLVGVLGGFEGIKFFINRSFEKKKAKAEADKAEAEANQADTEAQDAKYAPVIEHYKMLIAQDQERIIYYKDLVTSEVEHLTQIQNDLTEKIQSFQEIIEQKNAQISDLMDEINDLTSRVTALTFYRCDNISCPSRKPPFGYGGVDIKKGLLVAGDPEVK